MYRTILALGTSALVLSACSARASVPVAVEPAIIAVDVATADGGDRIWVCHRGRWQEVASPAAQGHSRHGDRVSDLPREARSSC